jgi:hypothetical protein
VLVFYLVISRKQAMPLYRGNESKKSHTRYEEEYHQRSLVLAVVVVY